MQIGTRLSAGRDRLSAVFVERELFLRSGERVRFLCLNRAVQVRAAIGALVAAALCLIAGALLINLHFRNVREQRALAAAQAKVARAAAANAAFRDASGNVAADLVRRQELIEELVKARLGDDAAAAAAATAGAPPPVMPRKTSGLPNAAMLAALAARQDAFARMLTGTFDARSDAAAATLRKLGIRPDPAAKAQGGPLEPIANGVSLTPALRRLIGAVDRWAVLQDNLTAVPSIQPTAGTPVTSSYGVRSDPFTGEAAFHAGMDFTGHSGQAILAAAPGRVVYVGQRSGYGNVVEIDHGHGLTTRYAHLSGFGVRAGQEVVRGARIAAMGSTGRSTGTHLHFEVRLNDAPMNPARFLALAGELAKVR